MHYYSHNIGSYDKKTKTLSLMEHGAYRRLLDFYYGEESPLPLDAKEQYKICGATTRVERAAVDVVVHKFFNLESDGFRHERCDDEISKYKQKQEKCREAASKGGSKKVANAIANATPDATAIAVANALANHKPITNNQEDKTPPTPSRGAVAGGSMAPEMALVFEAWNALADAHGLKPIRSLTGKRSRVLAARLQERDWAEHWKEALSRIASSDFCKGKGNTGWKADFDWFVSPDSLNKILEGKYDQRRANTGSLFGGGQPGTPTVGGIGSPHRYRTGTFTQRMQELRAKQQAEDEATASGGSCEACGPSENPV